MKRFFLIDLENVGKRALDVKDREALAKMSSDDVFVICQNRMHGSTPKELLNALEGTKASYRIIEIANCGKNALDFAVAAQLGYLISAEGKGAEYWIVSEDRGFEACKDFGAALGVKVGITPSYNIQEARRASQEEERAMLKSLLPEYSSKAVALTQKCLVAAKSLEDYHNRLQKQLYENQTRDVYLRTKHLLTAKG